MGGKPKPQLHVVRRNYTNSSVHPSRHASCAAVPINKQLVRSMKGQPQQKILTFSKTWNLSPYLVKKLWISELLSGELEAMF